MIIVEVKQCQEVVNIQEGLKYKLSYYISSFRIGTSFILL